MRHVLVLLALAACVPPESAPTSMDTSDARSLSLQPFAGIVHDPYRLRLVVVDDPAPYDILVHFHVITKGSEGRVSSSDLGRQMYVLRQAFADTPFAFHAVEWTNTDNASWHDAHYDSHSERQMMEALGTGLANHLDIYVRQNGGLLETSSFPWFPQERDGVHLMRDALPGGYAAPYNEGDVLVHAVGHWLGLYHTFQGGCRGGDDVDDTPPVATPNFSCAAVDSCSGDGPDDVTNYMDYTEDACIDHFTSGQIDRMMDQWELYRMP